MNKSKWIFGLLAVFIWSCDPKDDIIPDPQSEQVRSAIFDSMEEWYYWNDRLPATINTSAYKSNEELLDAIIYKPLDRFSYLTTQDEFNNAFVGRNAGHGFGFAFDATERLYLTFVYDESPAGKDGWKRGWEITEINGKAISAYKNASGGYDFQLGTSDPGITNSFTFKLPDGTTTTRTNAKAEYQSNSVLHQEIIDLPGKKVGYWVYQSFKATAGQTPTKSLEVDESMSFFETAGIDALIIDLRYNGGGSVAVAEQINNYLIQASHSDKLMYTNKLNSLKTDQQQSINFKKKGNLNLENLIFITSRGTASASELVINSLNPYVNITLIGDNTYGKPVGSFPLSSYNRTLRENNVELVPITFAIANSEGKAEYFDGFPADLYVGDTPQFNWGDQKDLRLASAIMVIENGYAGGRISDSFYRPKWEMIDQFKGLKQEFPAF
ncbi:C-terminal processing protease CtpA/Prc [Algoriphagus sp. 4150]|uniref:S41 family peptidase n=1 Tax=Algoriphagus sp. 4150 TaxID=2817756 RepID=UPI002861E954|nr:S41 family peptidase [Algoriphagus sp. 4150]MDR7132246.1 C-terminal processing protease CtpA/Prc [Algoriphagus sp. 4150]